MPPKRENKAKVDNDAPFEWHSCADETNSLKRLEIKEAACRVAERHGQVIEDILYDNLKESTASPNPSLCPDDVMGWVTQLLETRQNHSNFKVYIGVAGTTGAGKTSALNAIIGFRDLLPCSCEGAATAAVCLVGYNDDPDPKKKFRAEVVFRSEEDFRSELERCLGDIRLKAKLDQEAQKLADNPDEPTPNLAARAAALENQDEQDNNLDDIFGRILSIWDVEEDTLKDETVDGLLAKNKDVVALLGQTIVITDGDEETFSDRIKPYLDSSSVEHGDTGLQFPAWPLIEEVRIYVKSSILKNGVVLVDLPGLSDNVESRAAVAQKYFSKLSVTTIVTPVIRARDEQTGVQLMTEHQQLMLQMDGKFHKKGFCVVLSKIDDVDAKAHLKRHAKEVEDDATIRGTLEKIDLLNEEHQEGKEKLKRAESSFKALRKEFKAQFRDANATGKKGNTEASKALKKKYRETRALLQKERKTMHSLKQALERNRKSVKRLEGYKLHWCIASRNSHVEEDIQQDFERRQKRLFVGAEKAASEEYDGRVKILKISSKAYWQIMDDAENPLGFPDSLYTGVPEIRAWLRYASVSERERHLDMTLNAYHGLYNGMRAWSTNQWKEPLDLSPEFVKTQILDRSLHMLKTSLVPVFKKLKKDVQDLSPVRTKKMIQQDSRAKCIKVAKSWAIKRPDDRRCREKMHANTYNACILRRGGVFRSRGTQRYRYAWIEKMCNIFYEGIVQEWNIAINKKIPDLKDPVCHKIDDVWSKFLGQLRRKVKGAAPDMLPFLETSWASLLAIKEEVKDKASKAITEVSVGASQAHRSVQKTIQKKWDPAFRTAAKDVGLGRYARQRVSIEHFAERHGAGMFSNLSNEVRDKLTANLNQVFQKFDGVIRFSTERVSTHIMLLVDNATRIEVVVGGSGAKGRAPDYKQKAQKAVRGVVAEWAAHWRIGEHEDAEVRMQDTAIPDQYVEAMEEDEGEESDEDDAETVDDEETETEGD